MHEKILYHLQQLNQEYTTNCTSCLGSGCVTCSRKYDFIESLALAGIPLKYWSLTLQNIDPSLIGVQEIKNYVTKLKEAYEQGCGLYLYGSNGVGKTLCACEIGKTAIEQGFSVRFIFLGEVISAFVNTMYDPIERDRLEKDIMCIDFLIIDDIDKTYIAKNNEYILSLLDNLFRTRIQNCMPTIITSNKTMQELLEGEAIAGKSLLSLFSESILPVYIKGTDKRKDISKELRKQFLT